MSPIPSTTLADPLSVPFKSHPVFSLRFLSSVAIIAITVLVTVLSVASPERLLDYRFSALVAAYLALLILGFAGWRFIVRSKGGVPPIRFEADHLALPLHIHSLRVFRLAYGDIRSVTQQGKRQGRLTLDAGMRYFIYPLKDFVAVDAFETVHAELHRRIAALPEGAAQLEAMERQRERADYLSRRLPWVSWSIGAAIIVLFLFQTAWTAGHPLGIIDLGANAGALTFSGQWYRLVTANLLHANATHIFNNLIFLAVLGPLAERMLGVRRFLLLVLSTGMLSQLASAWWNQRNPDTAGAFSVGISGALFGILGALAILSHRFRRQLPSDSRLTARFWWIMLGLNFVLTPLITSNVDFSAHIGGLAAGLPVGWLLCGRQRELTAPPPFTLAHLLSLAALAAMSGISVGIVAAHLINADAQRASYATMIGAALHAAPNVVLDNQLSWAFASDPQASGAQLQAALALSRRTVKTVRSSKIVPQEDIDAYTDTMATLYYRTGDTDAATQAEETLKTLESTKMSQMARFLDRYRIAHGGPRLLGVAAGNLLEVSMDSRPAASRMRLAVRLPESLPQGARLYLVAHGHDRILGLVRITVPPTSGPAAYPDMPVAVNSPESAFTLRLAEIDATGCGCTAQNSPGATFFAMDKDVSDLP